MNPKLKVFIDNNPSALPAYHEGNWAVVPLFFVPEGAFNEETGEHYLFKITSPEGLPLESLDHDYAGLQIANAIASCVVPWLMPIAKLKELCRRFDIPIGWVTGILPQGKKKRAGLRRENRKVIPLTDEEWKKFIKQLRIVNKTSALIAEIVWFVNTQLAAGGGFITLEEVLRLKMDDVSPETDRSPCRIRCKRVGFSGLSLISHYLPSDLWAQLGKQIEPGTFFVFSGKNGAPFLLNHIERHFKEAGRLAGFSQEIVPLCLRPSFDEQAVELSKKCARDRALMDPVSENEWDIFCRLIPSLIQRRGCKSAHDPLHLLNAIFYHSLELCPFRKLPPYFPPWRAVAAQYRRWKEHGILDEILRLREGIRAGQIDP